MQVNDFKHGNHCRVLIASYETLRKHCESMAGMVDLFICDEGHRLKVSTCRQLLFASALSKLPLLSGPMLYNQ